MLSEISIEENKVCSHGSNCYLLNVTLDRTWYSEVLQRLLALLVLFVTSECGRRR